MSVAVEHVRLSADPRESEVNAKYREDRFVEGIIRFGIGLSNPAKEVVMRFWTSVGVVNGTRRWRVLRLRLTALSIRQCARGVMGVCVECEVLWLEHSPHAGQINMTAPIVGEGWGYKSNGGPRARHVFPYCRISAHPF